MSLKKNILKNVEGSIQIKLFGTTLFILLICSMIYLSAVPSFSLVHTNHTESFLLNYTAIDENGAPLNYKIKAYDENGKELPDTSKKFLKESPIAEIEFNASDSKSVSVKFKLKEKALNSKKGVVTLDNYELNNPEVVAPMGKPIKFVSVRTNNINYESARIKIKYTDKELSNLNESLLIISHYANKKWMPLNSSVDAENNTISAMTYSLSSFAVVYTGVSVNTKKSIYKPYEVVEFEITVLDKGGHPVCNAPINLSITGPDNSTYNYSTDNGIAPSSECGLYSAKHNVYLEGNYTVHVSATVNGNESTFETYFSVKQYYDFDIIRIAQNKIDPTKQDKFEVGINITSYTNASSIIIKEFVPNNFTVFTDAYVIENNNSKILAWNKDLVNGKTSVNYSYKVPSAIKKGLYEFGPVEIEYGKKIFTEARPWYVAVDPQPASVQGSVVDNNNTLLVVDITAYKEDGITVLHTKTDSAFNWTDLNTTYYLETDALSTKDVSAKFNISANWTGAVIKLDKYASNPEISDPPGTPVKYINVNATNASYSNVQISIDFTEQEMGNVIENIKIYQYNGTAWNALTTSLDLNNNIASANVTSLSTFALVTGAPTITTNDKWKLVFDSSFDNSYKAEGTWNPKVWLYSQNGSKRSGETIYWRAWCVNQQTQIGTGTATDNGDGSYSASFSTSGHNKHYIQVRFNTTVGSNYLTEERVIYVGNNIPSKGVPWKIVWQNASDKPTFNASTSHPIIVDLYGDSEQLIKGRTLKITMKTSTGTTLINAQTMTDNGDGTYTYTIPANTGTNGNDYYFEIYTKYNGKPTNKKDAYVYSGRYIEAISQGDISAPDLWGVKHTPKYPTESDNITIMAKALDDIGVQEVKVFYRLNEGYWQNITANPSGNNLYSADLGKFYVEDHIDYYVKAYDAAGNSRRSEEYNFFVDFPPQGPASAFVYLDQATYYFAKKSGTWSKDTNKYNTRTWPTQTENLDTIYPGAWTAKYSEWDNQIVEANTIRAFALIMDEKGRPISGLTNVKMWITNDTGYNLTKTAIDIGDGKYTAVFRGSKHSDGTYNDTMDGPAMWGKFTSRKYYYVNVSYDGDLIPEAQARWMAYTIGDTAWNDSNFYNIKAPSHCESEQGCANPDPHPEDKHYPKKAASDRQGRYDSSRSKYRMNCQDCHGYSKDAGQPGTGSSTNAKVWYGNAHPRSNTTNYLDCTDADCHGGTWYSGASATDTMPADMTVPEYPDGTYNITDAYYNPARCGKCHNFTDNVQPPLDGHNRVVGCKFCHNDYHSANKIEDYNDTTFEGTPGYAIQYAGYCYEQCHKTQLAHSGTVECRECHNNYETGPMHQSDLEPKMHTCIYCHQNSSYTYYGNKPPQIPYINHTTSTDGIWSSVMNYSRKYWNEQEFSCRYCHGRTFNENPGLGRPKNFAGNNVQNQSIGNGTWCASCHYQGYVSNSKSYDDMVQIYNSTFRMVPPEITGNASYAPKTTPINRTYINHTIFNIASNYNDSRCMNCHGAHLEALTINAFMHNVSFDSDPPYVDIWVQTPSDVKNNTSGNIMVNATASDGIGSGVNTSVNPHLWYRINNTGSEAWTDTGEMTLVSGTTWTGTIPDQTWSSQLNKTLEYYLSDMTDIYGNVGNSSVQKDFIQDYTNQPPSVPQLTSPVGGENWTGSKEIKWQTSSDDGKTPFAITYDLDYYNGTTWIDLATPSTNSYTWDTNSLSQGTTYKVRVRAYDGAEYSGFNTSFQFTIEHTPPYATTWIQTPSNVTVNTTGSISVKVTVTDALSGVNTSVNPHLWYRIDNDTNPSYIDAGTMSIVSGTTWEGTIPSQDWKNQSANTLQYYVSGMTDKAGNSGNSTVQEDYIEPLPRAGGLKVILTTNRRTILDDPGAASVAESGEDWNSDYWNGEKTTIRAKALVLDNKGHPISGENITFKIYDSTNTLIINYTVSTNSEGIASFAYSLNGYEDTDIGVFKIVATADQYNVSDTINFNYDFWGCGDCHGNKGANKIYTNGVSPYLGQYDFHGFTTNAHKKDETATLVNGNDCVSCHRRYGNNMQDTDMGPNKKLNSLASDAGTQTTYGLHEDKKYCQDCHTMSNGQVLQNASAAIKECNACHNIKNTKVTMNYAFINGTLGSGGKYVYSQSLVAHQANPTISCTLCHNAMHNITKPDASLGTNNSYTEDNQCTACHTNQGKHSTSNPVYCTSCHSQDAHAIKVLNKTATTQPSYVNLSSTGAITKAETDCMKCHSSGALADFFGNLTVTDSSAYAKNYNTTKDVFGYTIEKHNGTVGCTVCHENTTYHSISFLTPTNTYSTNNSSAVTCVDCHNGTNTEVRNTVQTKFGSLPPTKQKHNNSVDCTKCHGPSPHGIRILDKNGSFMEGSANFSSPNRVNCINCHQGSGLSGFSNAPKVSQISHSENTYNGSLWDRGTDFWTNTSEVSKCNYCHGDTKHNTSALGYPNTFKGNNVVGGDLSGEWCASCHYQNNSNYNSMVTTLNPVPPEITRNATYGNYTIAHDGTTNYYNHGSIGGFKDSNCKGCHDKNASTTNTQFIHNVSTGKAGPNCISCHGKSGSATHLVNESAIELGMHSKVNNGSSNSTNVSAENKKCWGCHTSNGNEPAEGSMGDRYNNPWACIDCHTQDGARNQSTWTNNSVLPPVVYEHQPNAINIKTNVGGNGTCQNCHNNSLAYNNDTKGGNLVSNVSHYGTTSQLINTGNCDNQNCHKNVQWGYDYGNAPQTLMGSQGVNCTYCHTLNKTVPVDNLHNNSIGTYWRCFDAGCHNLGGRRRIGANIFEEFLKKAPQHIGFPVQTDAKIDSTPILFDINQDGLLEIIISNEKKVYVLDVNGTILPNWPKSVNGASIFSSPAVGDIDGDKEVEIVIGGGYMNSHVQAWKIDGTLVFDVKLDADVYSTPTLVDLDGDGSLEIIIGTMSGMVYGLQGDGSIIFSWQTQGKVGSNPSVEDIDNDGDIEIVVTSMDGKVYAWNSDGTSVNGFPVNAESLWLSSLAIADLDKDGKDEIIVASNAGKIYAFHNNGSLVEGWPVNTDQIWHSTPAIEDLDNDGNQEIVVGSDFGKVYAFHKDGSRVNGFPIIVPEGVVSSPVLTDLNGDKKMEIVIGSMDGKVYAWSYDGSLVSGFPKETSKAWIKGSPAVADIDQDGNQEVVIGSEDGKVYVWKVEYNWTKGDFNGDGKVDLEDVTKVAYMVLGLEPQDLRADFNQNGRVDIGDAAKIAYYVVGKIREL